MNIRDVSGKGNNVNKIHVISKKIIHFMKNVLLVKTIVCDIVYT